MKSITRARFALAALNVLLVAALLATAKAILLTKHEAHVPPLDVASRIIRAKPPDGALYDVIWKELDRPPPPPEKPAPSEPAPPPIEGLVRVASAGETGGERVCILLLAGANEQLVLRAGESFGGWTCSGIERDERGWAVAVKNAAGGSGVLRLRREEEPAR